MDILPEIRRLIRGNRAINDHCRQLLKKGTGRSAAAISGVASQPQ